MVQQIKIYNSDGNVTGEIAAPEFLLQLWDAGVVHQVFKAIAANRRTPVAHTKDRSEVSGGGIKPWKQKGTGRARHGSNRSPLWRHGGVTFGPRNTTDFSQKVNKKAGKLALQMALAKKFSLGELKILNKLALADSKTKNLAKIIKNLIGNKSALLAVGNGDKVIRRAAANLAKIDCRRASDLNAYEILNNKFVLMDQEVLASLFK